MSNNKNRKYKFYLGKGDQIINLVYLCFQDLQSDSSSKIDKESKRELIRKRIQENLLEID